MILTERIEKKLHPQAKAFLESLEGFQKLVSQHQFRVQTHTPQSLDKFLSLPQETQSQIALNFTNYLGFLTASSENGINLGFDSLLVRTFLKEFGYIHDENLYSTVAEGDVVEVYTLDQTQIFRNLRFLDLCDYTLLDLLIYEPYELYERSEKVIQSMLEAVGQLFNRPFNLQPLNVRHIPQHTSRERFSKQKLTSLVQFKYLYPLYRWPQDLVGFIVVAEGRNIAEMKADLSFL